RALPLRGAAGRRGGGQRGGAAGAGGPVRRGERRPGGGSGVSPLRLLHAGEHVVAVDKPAGVPVIPGRDGGDGPSVRALLEAQLGRRVWVVHRLDRDTSGVLVFALDADAHRELNLAFEAGRVRKAYLALAAGTLEGPRTVDVPLVPARRGRMRPARP